MVSNSNQKQSPVTYQNFAKILRSFIDLLATTILSLLLWCHFVEAQYPPPLYTHNFTTVNSPADGNITISYQSPPVGTCTTVFGTQKQYTGYVTLPPSSLSPSQGNYTINTFFWFIEARQLPESAPLTVFINGGPGSSSMVGLFQEVGPCQVVEISNGKLGTAAREWGWDRSSNIVFIDQPVQVGFSYDVTTNASLNFLDESLTYPPTAKPVAQPIYTFLNGTFSSGSSVMTANTSKVAAESIWHFLQGFLTTFPQYNPGVLLTDPQANRSADINLFTESYGGKFGPAIGAFFRRQNQLRISDSVFADTTIEINLRSLGIINGWIDLLIQTPFHPRFAYNNSYGIEAISQVDELNALSAFNAAGGCRDLTVSCRSQEAAYDANGGGDLESINSVCSQAQFSCQANVIGPYSSSGRSIYDISQNVLNPYPESHYLEYLNTLEVQQAIGAPVNYTQESLAVYYAFNGTGDYARDGIIQDLVDLLNSGVRIALIYGDRDYICNWLGGEAISFSIAGAAGTTYLPWHSAGYAPIVSNSSYIGGVVRQYGNLSFSRIYDAGHLVPAYQPETAFTVFSRIIEGTDISLGSVTNLTNYATFGDLNSTYPNTAPAEASPTCYLRAVNGTCNRDQKNMLANNAGVIINGVLYSLESDWSEPDPDITTRAGVPGTAPVGMYASAPTTQLSTVTTIVSGQKTTTKTTDLPTGVYTATAVPNVTTSSARSAATQVTGLRAPQPAAVVLGLLCLGMLCG